MKLLLENWRKYLKEDTEPYPYQIYCDMDGVLVDFEVAVVDQINADIVDESIQTDEMLALRIAMRRSDRPTWGKEAATGPMRISKYDINKDIQPRPELIQAARNYMYASFKSNQEFWARLPWMEDGKELWNYIKGYNPIILTTPMGESSKTNEELTPSEIGKTLWVETHLGKGLEIIFSNKKYEKATTTGTPDGIPNVLIDDFSTNTEPWLIAGGFAILHTNFDDTKAGLEYIATISRQKSTS